MKYRMIVHDEFERVLDALHGMTYALERIKDDQPSDLLMAAMRFLREMDDALPGVALQIKDRGFLIEYHGVPLIELHEAGDHFVCHED